MKRRFPYILLALCFSLCSLPMNAFAASKGNAFTKVRSYDNIFSDVPPGAWYENGVRQAYEYGLMNGIDVGVFSAMGTLSLGEAVALSTRLYSAYAADDHMFPPSEPWYQSFIDYGTQQGIVSTDFIGYDFALPATRAQFALLISSAVPDEALTPIGTVLDNAIPDVPAGHGFPAAVYRLYRAGILTGSDTSGRFYPVSTIQRGEVATIITRIVDPSSRVVNDYRAETFTLYAADGRTIDVPSQEASNYLSVDWYLSMSDALSAHPEAVLPSDLQNRSYGFQYFKPGAYGDGKMRSIDSPSYNTIRMELSDNVSSVSNYTFSDAAGLIRLGIPDSVIEIGAGAFSASHNTGLRVYCVSGSAAHIAASAAGITTVPARPVYSAETGYCCMVTDEERPFYLNAGWYESKEAAIQAIDLKLQESVDKIILSAEAYASEGAYDLALTALRAASDEFDSGDTYYTSLMEKQRIIADAWRDSSSCPIGATSYSISRDVIGNPEATIQLWNLSYKTITAFKIQFDCYDAFGAPSRAYDGSYTFRGYSDSEELAPLDYTQATWTLYVQDNTKTIRNIRITQIMFSDGTSWGR